MADRSESESSGGTGGDQAEARLSGVALWLGVLVILAWLGMIVFLLLHRSETEPAWSRLILLFGSIETVACLVAGAMFGAQVQRRRVADARLRANRAEGEAKANLEAAARGRALATAVKVKATASGKGTDRLGAAAAGPADMELLATLADDVLAAQP